MVEFSLKDKDGKVWSRKDFKGKWMVLYFYPKDDTPGCTLEAMEFSKDLEAYKKIGADVIGISGGDEKSKEKFCRKHDLKVLLLSDPDFSVSKGLGVYVQKSFMGRKYMGIERTTIVVDKDGNIVKRFEKVNPQGHSKEVLEYLKNN